jgi:hypothetical protein
MSTQWTETAASHGLLVGIGPLVAGVIVVALLIGAVRLGLKVRRREPGPPRPEEQPRLPTDGPVREMQEHREPNEVPRSDHRMTPHELRNQSSRPERRP